jgi:hypothetical protein
LYKILSLLVACKLSLDQFFVRALPLDEFIMVTLLYNDTMFKYDDAPTIADSREAVCNYNDCFVTVVHKVIDSRLHFIFALSIECGCGFVEY